MRDLSQLAVRVATRHVGDGPISPGDIPPDDRPGPSAEARWSTADPDGTPAGSDAWHEQMERAIRTALRAGIGLKQLKALVPEMATGMALTETDGPAAAARMLGVSRRAVDYRRSGAAVPPQAAPPSSAATS